MISDGTLLLIFAFALGFIANRYMSHQNILTGDVEEGTTKSQTHQLIAVLLVLVVIIFGIWGSCELTPPHGGLGDNYVVGKSPRDIKCLGKWVRNDGVWFPPT